jgi:hypothetical protein
MNDMEKLFENLLFEPLRKILFEEEKKDNGIRKNKD